MPRSQQDAGSQEWKGTYLEIMAQAPFETEAAKLIGKDIGSIRRARTADPQFAQDEAEAKVAAVALLALRLWAIAIGGNVTALIFLLKKLDPETYGDHVEVSGIGGGPVPVTIESPRERLEQRFSDIRSRTGGGDDAKRARRAIQGTD